MVSLESFSAQFAGEGSDVGMNPSLVFVQILKWFLAIAANDCSIRVYFLMNLEFEHGSVTFATLIARKVPDISVVGMYHLLVPLQGTFLAETFSTFVTRMFTNLGMCQEV